MSAYIQLLNSIIANTTDAVEAEPLDLRARFESWFNSLPAIARQRPFSMAEFEAALGTQGRHLSAVLIGLGWRRGRRWVSRYHYHRFWLPPRS
jgi:hypothetical protein